MFYRRSSDYESSILEEKINQIEQYNNNSGSYKFTQSEMIPIFQSGNTAVYDSSSKMYVSKYAFMVPLKDGNVLFIDGEGYFPKSSTGTPPPTGNTMIVEKYTLCTVSSSNVPPFTSNIIKSTSFITAGSEQGYLAQGTYRNQKDDSTLSVKVNGDRVVTFAPVYETVPLMDDPLEFYKRLSHKR